MSDIVERLREISQRNAWLVLCDEAADEIERLRERDRRLTDQRNGLLKGLDQKDDDIKRLLGLLREYADVVRLVREGKPVPLAYLEDRIREALGND